MNNSPLQPLVWTDNTIDDYIDHRAQGAGVSYRVCYFADKFRVYWVDSMGGSDGNKEFNSLDELKHWVDTDHYPHKMQPYVRPSPTWIDASERLPKEDGLYLAYYPDQLHKQQIVFFSLNINKFNYFHDLVTHWQPLPNPPELSTMQNLHKGE